MVMASAVSALTRLIMEPVTTISCNSGVWPLSGAGVVVAVVVVAVVVCALAVDALAVDALAVVGVAAVAVAAVATAASATRGRRANLCLFLIVELLDIDVAPVNNVAIDQGCVRCCAPA